MKQKAFQVVLCVSLAGAMILGFRNLQSIYEMCLAVPEEIDFFPAPPARMIRSLFIALWPVGLYFSVLIFARQVGWSRLGGIAFTTQIIYVGTLLWVWLYVHDRFVLTNEIHNPSPRLKSTASPMQ